MNKKMVIGLGTGRCGTVSLSQFLDEQPSGFQLHEGRIGKRRELISWENDEERLLAWLAELQELAGDATHAGDTGYYFLPYAELIWEQYPDTYFVCFERDREGVVESFYKKTDDGRHFWYDHQGEGFRKDSKWDPTFPKFDQPDKRAAIGQYWDLYHEEATRLAALNPSKFRIFPMTILNTEAGRSEILDFVEYNGDRLLSGDFKRNTRKDNRNLRYWLKRKLGLA